MVWEKYGLAEWNTIPVKWSKSDAAGDMSLFHFARYIPHRDTLALPDLQKLLPTALHKGTNVVSSMKDRPLYIQAHNVNIVRWHAGRS
jgi:hypothetical protein